MKRETVDAGHDAVFSSASVHFTLSSNTHKPLDINKACRRLLATDVASSAAWPDSDKIYVPERMRKHARKLYSARRMQLDFRDLREAPSWSRVLRFAFRHPGDPHVSWLAMKSVWAGRLREDVKVLGVDTVPVKDLIWFLVRHPFFGSVHVLPNLRYTRDKKSQKPPVSSEDLPATLADAAEENAAVTEADAEASNDDDTSLDDLSNLLDDAEQVYIEQQVVSAAERKIDSNLLGGRDRDEDRFVRLVLRQSYHELLVPGKDETVTAVFEPRLFLHESGAVQLTIQVSAEGPLSTEDVVRLMLGQGLFSSSRMPRPLIHGTTWESAASWSGEMDVEAELGDLKHEAPVSMSNLLLLHLTTVGLVIGTRLPQNWMNYPTGILAADDCCPPGQWRHTHEVDIKKVMLRFDTDAEVADHVKVPGDLSSSADHSLFTNMAATSYFQWEGEAPKGISELATTLVVEYALYLYWRLQMLEEQASAFRLGDRRLRRLYRRSILVFAELRQGNLRTGDARRIAVRLLRDLGGDELRATVETALNLSGEAYSTVSASRSSRRAWWLTLLGTVLAVLVALPQIQGALDAVRKWKVLAPWNPLLDPIRGVASWSPWLILLAGAGAVFAAWLLSWVVRLGRAFFSTLVTRRGYAWPSLITIDERPLDEVETGSAEASQPSEPPAPERSPDK